jgi:hypothetical protein
VVVCGEGKAKTKVIAFLQAQRLQHNTGAEHGSTADETQGIE